MHSGCMTKLQTFAFTSDQADAVGDEFCCSAGVEVRPQHAAPHTAALVEGAGADRV